MTEFLAAYDALLARWPAGTETIDAPSRYGRTRVISCGPRGGAPLVLLSGGGATATAWFAVAAELAGHRLYAVDRLGDAGRSAPLGAPLHTRDDLVAWLDAVLDHLGLHNALLCGHSYGGWLALWYALHSPDRVRRLALLDPTTCFARFRPSYLLRAVPQLVRSTPDRVRTFLLWETGGRVDRQWLHMAALGATVPTSRLVMPKRPEPARLRALAVPTLVLVAERSKAHDVNRVATTAARLLPVVTTVVLPGATHHSIPTEDAKPLAARLLPFLSGAGP
jgi:pimeloyl-ACP methyl ester carboxylesterase